ncbi:hypothetical protein [Novosphingobium indicum]|uniref:hypothetical protein n=1 Tax=Novosphingobium indicum TaxID=462949 RepID=UPI0016654B49|nr:hypothetical protein [Novosphingobium indicum]
MKSLLQLLASLFLVLGVVTGSMAHAAEIRAEKSAASGAEFFKSTKDTVEQGKDSSSDSGTLLVKCYGCHCHHIAVPVEAGSGEVLGEKLEILPAGPGSAIAPPTLFDVYRPPMA